MAGAYKMAHKNAANCPKLFGGQFAAFICGYCRPCQVPNSTTFSFPGKTVSLAVPSPFITTFE